MMGRRSSVYSLTLCALSLANLVSSPAAAEPPCTRWDVTGMMPIAQGSNAVTLYVEQSGTTFTGKATNVEEPKGLVDGVIQGNSIKFTVYWNAGSVGVYKGTIGPTGRIEGWTHDKRNPGSNAPWYSAERLKCVSRGKVEQATSQNSAEAQPPPPPKPGKILGKKKPSACKPGFVWRVAKDTDLVCVTPDSRTLTAQENRLAASRRDPAGAYGPNSCKPGFVWRVAYESDLVCVPPPSRDRVLQENKDGPSRRVTP